MDFLFLFVLIAAFSMVMIAVYVTVRSQVFGTSPSVEFHQFCMNSMDRYLFKTANKNKITLMLAEKGTESYEYLHANVNVAKQVFDKYLEELQEERRVEELPNAGSASVYKLCD